MKKVFFFLVIFWAMSLPAQAENIEYEYYQSLIQQEVLKKGLVTIIICDKVDRSCNFGQISLKDISKAKPIELPESKKTILIEICLGTRYVGGFEITGKDISSLDNFKLEGNKLKWVMPAYFTDKPSYMVEITLAEQIYLQVTQISRTCLSAEEMALSGVDQDEGILSCWILGIELDPKELIKGLLPNDNDLHNF